MKDKKIIKTDKKADKAAAALALKKQIEHDLEETRKAADAVHRQDEAPAWAGVCPAGREEGWRLAGYDTAVDC